MLFLLLVSRNLQFQTSEPTTSFSKNPAKGNKNGSLFSSFSACEIAPHRCALIDLTKLFGFVHISKCAGASWIRELKKFLPQVYPTNETGAEWTVAWHRQNNPSDYLATSLKSPRHHVWSLFTECKYDKWGIKITNGTNFPRSGNTPEDDIRDFNQWLLHFTTHLPAPAADCYNCYDPSNYHSQHLAGTEQQQRCRPPMISPNITCAKQTYWELDFVAITKFYHESKCLLFHRMVSSGSELRNLTDPKLQTSVPTMHRFLDQECVCPLPSNVSDVCVTHHGMADDPSSETWPAKHCLLWDG